MELKSVCICGHFGFGKNLLNGQTIKTKIIAEAIEKQLGEEKVEKVDTHGGIKAIIRLPFLLFSAMRRCKNIVILPANNGLRIIPPLLTLFNAVFKRKLHYAVVGGWLANFISNKKTLTRQLKRFDGIYVETSTMKSSLEAMGFDNIYVMPNCKPLEVLTCEELVFPSREPYKLCTFSRVMKEKGIEDALDVVKSVNEKCGKTVYSLEFFGQVDEAQTEWFEQLKTTFPEYVSYGGMIPYDQSVKVIKEYFALLFPTKFYTEGVPGTIIDAYAAGVPVVSAKWESFSDVIDENSTGVGYEFGDYKQFEDILLGIAQTPQKMIDLKENCINKAKEYMPETVAKVMIQNFNC